MERKQDFLGFFQNFCENTSVHGMRYVGQRHLSWTEKAMWMILVVIAFWGIVLVSLLIQSKYQESLLSTVVETTNYHISEISFPAVTLCNNHRVDFGKFEAAIDRFLPNASQGAKDTFHSLLMALEVLDFGSFDELENVLRQELDALEQLSLREATSFMSFACSDLFVRCWWRNKYLPCCELFTTQWSEYGACYSFNSASSADSPEVNRSYAWPWRVSSYNEWSALRVEYKVKQSIYYNASRPAGLLFMVHNPYEWPNIARFIPAGATRGVRIWATTFYVSPEVQDLPIRQRQCIYQKGKVAEKWTHLEGLPYLRPNCVSECRRMHMMQYCNCSVDIFFPQNVRYPACPMSKLRCLNEFNDYFNYEVPPQHNEFFNEAEDGMLCDCLPECDRIEYKIEVHSDLAMSARSSDTVTLDFHFGGGEMVRYRTDISFGWLDLMVSFGGVAGLFLGMSLLSGVEMIYYLTVWLWAQAKRMAHYATPRRHDSRVRAKEQCKAEFFRTTPTVSAESGEEPVVVGPKEYFQVDQKEWGYHIWSQKNRF